MLPSDIKFTLLTRINELRPLDAEGLKLPALFLLVVFGWLAASYVVRTAD